MAPSSASAPARAVYLLLGEDAFRVRLRLAELVAALVRGDDPAPGDLAAVERPDLVATLGVVRHDARSAEPGAIAMSAQARGLFDAVDERRVVIVEHADALPDHAFIEAFPEGSALVLVTLERLPSRGRRPPARRR
ncbi:MAG: hypothetical protein ACRDF0_01570, partial [Candidatus Limnocylindria bacterium]